MREGNIPELLNRNNPDGWFGVPELSLLSSSINDSSLIVGH
jgi:hypothetical protein